MAVIRESIWIDAAPARVWEFLATPGNAERVDPSIRNFTSDTEGMIEKGTRSTFDIRVAGRNLPYVFEAVEAVAGERLAYRSLEGPIEVNVTYRVSGWDGGTQVEFTNETGTFGGAFGKMADTLATTMYARDVRRNLATLKDMIEHDVA